MAKKNFKNPALNFISEASIEAVEGNNAENSIPTGIRKAPEGYKINPLYIETKSKRVQILLQPSVYNKAKAVSAELGISLNDYINRILEIANHSEEIQGKIKEDIEG